MQLSIITPSYNQGRFIERTIKSVKNQKINNIEHIIFDNESSDETSKILKKYKKIVRSYIEKDNGQSHAINKGFKLAKGDIIGWINSDDIYHNNIFIEVIKFFKNNPFVDVIYGEANHIDESDNQINMYETENWDINRLKDVCYICQPTVFFRKKIFKKIGYLDEKLNYCMDYDYWIRMSKQGLKVSRLKLLMAGSRLYETNKTLGSRLKVHNEINYMLKRNYTYTPDKWIFNYAHVKTDDLSIKRERKYLYLFFVTIFTFYASLKWNKKISFRFFYLALKLYGIIK